MNNNNHLIHLSRLFLISIGFLSFFSSHSIEKVEYTPFIEEGKTWWYAYSEISDADLGPENYYFGLNLCGDTIVGENTWKKCMIVNTDGTPIISVPMALLREDNQKVYRLIKHDMIFEAARDAYGANTSYLPHKKLFSNYLDFFDYSIFADVMYAKEEHLLYDFSDSENVTQFWPSSFYRIYTYTPFAEKIFLDELGNYHNCYFINKPELTEQYFNNIQAIFGTSEVAELEYDSWSDYIFNNTNEEIITKPNYLIEGIGPCSRFYISTILNPYFNDRDFIPGIFTWICPDLVAISLKDGRFIYGSKYFSPTHTPSLPNTEDADIIYDIYGNKTDIPHLKPGTVYIKNHKKFIN